MGKTTIEWTATVNPDGSVTPGRTWNPTRGCSRVSQGCVHCYAEKVANRFKAGPFAGFVSRGKWTGKVELIESMLDAPLHWKKPARIFVNSMSDLFHEALHFDDISDVWSVMKKAHWHTYQILTKRAARMAELMPRLVALHGVLPNVWIGVSVEDQATADERVPQLLSTPAAIRFISYEPALGPVDFTKIDYRAQLRETLMAAVRWSAERHGDADVEAKVKEAAASVPDGDLGEGNNPALNVLTGAWFDGWDSGDDGKKINWLICGGESGPGARPFDLEWARNAIEQCRDAGVAFFFKQAGARPFGIADRITSRGEKTLPDGSPNGFYRILNDRKGGDISELPGWVNVRQFPEVRA